jgi:hypothetical protein
MAQRRCQPAQGAKPCLGPIGNAGKARFLAPAHHHGAALRRQGRRDPVDQPRAFEQRLRLVTAEPPRLPAS